MMRHSEKMRAASRLLLSHPIVCLLAALAAVVVVLGVLGPTKVVHAGTITPSATTSARLVGAGDIADDGNADVATGNLIDARPNARVFTAGDNAYPNGSASDFTTKYEPAWGPLQEPNQPFAGKSRLQHLRSECLQELLRKRCWPSFGQPNLLRLHPGRVARIRVGLEHLDGCR